MRAFLSKHPGGGASSQLPNSASGPADVQGRFDLAHRAFLKYYLPFEYFWKALGPLLLPNDGFLIEYLLAMPGIINIGVRA